MGLVLQYANVGVGVSFPGVNDVKRNPQAPDLPFQTGGGCNAEEGSSSLAAIPLRRQALRISAE